MARATRAGGPSHTPAELADPDLPVRIRRAEIGYIDRPKEESLSQDGGGSTQSSENESTASDRPTAARRKRAPTTASHSSQQEMETDSTAHTTDGDGRSSRSKQSARVRSTDDEFDEFG